MKIDLFNFIVWGVSVGMVVNIYVLITHRFRIFKNFGGIIKTLKNVKTYQEFLKSKKVFVHIYLWQWDMVCCLCFFAKCQPPCGAGIRVRRVHCVAENGDILPADECDRSMAPHDIEKCFAPKCPAPTWTVGAWSEVQSCGVIHCSMK